MPSRLFVYGTLKRDCEGAHHLRGAVFEGSATTAPGYALADLGDYPALVADGDDVVRGEVFTVTEADLAALDAYEGAPELFQRTPIALSDGSEAEAYTMSPARVAGRPRIEGGVWLRRTP